MNTLKDLIDKEKLKQEIEMLKNNLQQLNRILENGMTNIKIELAYQNGNTLCSTTFPEDYYYLVASP